MGKGKYEHLQLPRLQSVPNPDDSTKQGRVDLAKIAILAGKVSVESLADHLLELRKAMLMIAKGSPRQASVIASEYTKFRLVKDALKAYIKDVDDYLEAYKQLVVDQFEVEATRQLRMVTGDAVRVQYEPYTVVEDKDTFRQWCIKNGYGNALILPWQSANAMTKERLLDGKTEADGTRAYMVTKVVFTKG